MLSEFVISITSNVLSQARTDLILFRIPSSESEMVRIITFP